MAQSDAEKKRKAHEYYVKYRKKGIKKGRKKSSKTAQKGLTGVTTSGLNSDGAIEANAIKERLKKEMNTALAKAKTDEERKAIQKEYAKKANAEIAKLKADPKYAKAKATKSGGSKGSSSKGSGSKGSSSKSSGSSTSTASATQKQMVQTINAKMAELEDKLAKMPEEQRAKVRDSIREQIDLLREMLKKK